MIISWKPLVFFLELRLVVLADVAGNFDHLGQEDSGKRIQVWKPSDEWPNDGDSGR